VFDSQPNSRRLLLAVSVLVLVSGVFLALALPRPASAEPPQCPSPTNPDCGPVITHHNYTNTLTVSHPSAGTITSSPSDISCPAGSGGTCTVSDTQTVECSDGDCPDPNPNGWQTYTLAASGGPSGFAPTWGGACSGSSCSVTLDDDKSVSMTWIDVTNPTVSVSPGSVKVGKTLNASATASDNAGVAKVEFWLDGVLKATDTSAPYSASIAMDGYAQGSTHTLLARAYDTSGRTSDSSSTVTVDKVVNLTVGTLPAYTNASTVPLSISTDPDASMKCSVNGSPPAACSGTYSPLSSPADGSYSYTVTATDDVGNVASATRTFTVDRTAPDASFTDGPSEGAIVGSGPIAFKFNYTDSTPTTVTCALDSAAFTPCDSSSSETLDGLAAGSSHTFHVQFVDSAGNTTELVRHFSVAAPAPTGTGGSGSGSGGGGGGNAGGGSGTGGGTQGVLGAGPSASKAKLSSGFKLKGKNTLVRKLVVTRLPSGAKVTVHCKGHGCPFRSKSFKAKHGSVSLSKVFKGRKLAKGARIEIDVTVPGEPKQVFRLTTRKGKRPLLKSA
jgi:hypothetical protein